MGVSPLRAEPAKSSAVVKPPALTTNSRVGIFAPASPAEESRVARGLEELRSLKLIPLDDFSRESQAYFSAPAESRLNHFVDLLKSPNISGLIALRGGYGS